MPTLFCIVKELMLKMFSQNDGGSERERERVKSRLVQAHKEVPRCSKEFLMSFQVSRVSHESIFIIFRCSGFDALELGAH